jgi:FkbM family methyltransferase
MSALRLLGDILGHPANRDARVSALIRSLAWQCTKRLTGQPHDIPYHGKLLRCHPTSHSASRAIYFSCLPDYWEMRFILDYLRPGDTFIDIGANIGLYTLLALAIVGAEGHVHAFEPNHRVASMLRESLALNAAINVTVHEIGLSDMEGTAAFAADGDDCTAHIVDLPGDSGAHIPIDRLDRLLGEAPYAMMKLDIEGYEPFAIRGASQWTKKQIPPVMLVEVGGYSKKYGIGTQEFIEELDRIGYFTAIYHPESRQIEPAAKPWDVGVDNLLAIAKDRQEFVEDRIREQASL